MNYLIVGATGNIGGVLYNELARTDTVFGTHRKRGCIDRHLLEFDMSKKKLEFPVDPFKKTKEKTAVICAAVSSIRECYENYEQARLINVINTIRLVSYLVDCGYRIIFLSTDNVFDGRKGNYSEEDLSNPVNKYGKMKREVEEYLLRNYPQVIILRLCKVVGNQNSQKDLFKEWKDLAIKKKKIRCVKDNFFTPLFIGDISKNIIILANAHKGGIYHLGGNGRYNRADLCDRFLTAIGIKTELEECSIRDLGLSDGWPLDTSFKSDKIKHMGGLFTSIENVFDLYK